MSKSRPAIEKVNLFFSVKGLIGKTIFGRTVDSFAVIYEKEPNGDLKKVSTTEVLRNNSDPVWLPQTVNFIFGISQEIVVKIYLKSPNHDTENECEHTVLGEVLFYLPTLILAAKMDYPITSGKKEGGMVTVRAEKQVCVNDVLCVTFTATNLVNVAKGLFGKPDPFLQISRPNEDEAHWSIVWKSVVKSKTLTPTWSQEKIPLQTLCNGDRLCPLLVEVYDYKRNGKHVFMGKMETNVLGLLQVGEPKILVEPAKVGTLKGYVNSGTLTSSDAILLEKPTFLDYLAGGSEISLIVGIDFTASNGDPSDPTSLHYIDPRGGLNAYEQVISSVGAVLKTYDTDNMYPVLGFGARIDPPYGPILHNFQVNDSEREVNGVEGILEVYRKKLRSIQLMGPTFFQPIITEAVHIAAAANSRDAEKQKYAVLLILTDGTINDVDDTVEAIRAASSKPISIVIIGVGNADFSTMISLGQCAESERDIVQFIEFRDYELQSPEVLAANLLSKIPQQFVQYMYQHNIKPSKK